MKLGIAVGQYKRPIAAVQTCVNMFPEKSENRSLAEVTLRPTPGLSLVIGALGGGNGALYTFNDVLYVISGGTLYSISSTGIGSSLGSINSGDIPTIADNGSQMIIVVGGTVRFSQQYFLVSGRNIIAGYIFNGTTLAQITDPAFPQGDAKDALFFSDIGDGSSWAALNFFSAESNPDPIRGHVTSHGNQLIFGNGSLEYWTPTSDSNLPFQKSQGSEQERGCLAAQSITSLDNTIFFLGDDRVVYKVLDFRPVRVSHHAMEAVLEQATLGELNSEWVGLDSASIRNSFSA